MKNRFMIFYAVFILIFIGCGSGADNSDDATSSSITSSIPPTGHIPGNYGTGARFGHLEQRQDSIKLYFALSMPYGDSFTIQIGEYPDTVTQSYSVDCYNGACDTFNTLTCKYGGDPVEQISCSINDHNETFVFDIPDDPYIQLSAGVEPGTGELAIYSYASNKTKLYFDHDLFLVETCPVDYIFDYNNYFLELKNSQLDGRDLEIEIESKLPSYGSLSMNVGRVACDADECNAVSSITCTFNNQNRYEECRFNGKLEQSEYFQIYVNDAYTFVQLNASMQIDQYELVNDTDGHVACLRKSWNETYTSKKNMSIPFLKQSYTFSDVNNTESDINAEKTYNHVGFYGAGVHLGTETIVGTWSETSNGKKGYQYIFNEDGTGERIGASLPLVYGVNDDGTRLYIESQLNQGTVFTDVCIDFIDGCCVLYSFQEPNLKLCKEKE